MAEPFGKMFRSMYSPLPHGVPFTCIICIIMGQEFILVPEPVHQLTGGNVGIELIWDFDNNSIPLIGTTWRNGNDILVMRKTANQPPVVPNDFFDRVFYRSPFGISIRNLTQEDEGEYTCKVVYTGGEKENKVNVTLYNVIGGLFPKIELYYDDQKIIENGTEVNVESKVLAKYLVPIQNPVAIVTSISTDLDGIVEIRETCDVYNGTYCQATFKAPDKAGVLIISACNSHPALKEELCESVAVNIIACRLLCENGGTCNQSTLECICPDGFTGDKCESELGEREAECKWWCILLIVLPMVIVVLVIICCCWHYKVACFRHECSNRRSKVDVNYVERTVTSGSHDNKQDAVNKDNSYRDVHRPDGNMTQKGDGSHGLKVPQGVPVTNSDQKRPMPSPGRKIVLLPLKDTEMSSKKK